MSKIHQIPQGVPGMPLDRDEPGHCHHWSFDLDETESCVSCRQCGEEVPPLLVVRRLARKSSNWKASAERMKREIARLGAVLEDMRREERNAKARIRRARAGA